MDLAPKALRALRYTGYHGMGHILGTQHFRRILCAAPGESRSDTSRANHTHSDAVFAKIFRHAAGKTDDTPFGRAIDAAASEGIFSGERTDVDDVARATADHGTGHCAGNEENTLEIGIPHAVPIGFGLLVGGPKPTEPGTIDADGAAAQSRL